MIRTIGSLDGWAICTDASVYWKTTPSLACSFFSRSLIGRKRQMTFTCEHMTIFVWAFLRKFWSGVKIFGAQSRTRRSVGKKQEKSPSCPGSVLRLFPWISEIGWNLTLKWVGKMPNKMGIRSILMQILWLKVHVCAPTIVRGLWLKLWAIQTFKSISHVTWLHFNGFLIYLRTLVSGISFQRVSVVTIDLFHLHSSLNMYPLRIWWCFVPGDHRICTNQSRSPLHWLVERSGDVFDRHSLLKVCLRSDHLLIMGQKGVKFSKPSSSKSPTSLSEPAGHANDWERAAAAILDADVRITSLFWLHTPHTNLDPKNKSCLLSSIFPGKIVPHRRSWCRFVQSHSCGILKLLANLSLKHNASIFPYPCIYFDFFCLNWILSSCFPLNYWCV